MLKYMWGSDTTWWPPWFMLSGARLAIFAVCTHELVLLDALTLQQNWQKLGNALNHWNKRKNQQNNFIKLVRTFLLNRWLCRMFFRRFGWLKVKFWINLWNHCHSSVVAWSSPISFIFFFMALPCPNKTNTTLQL